MRSLAELTYLRAGVIVAAAVVALLVAAPLAAGVFEQTKPFDISDPDSEVQRAYAAYEEATGAQSEPEVLLLVEPGPDSSITASTAEAAERLGAVEGIAGVVGPDERRELLAADDGVALVVGFLEAGESRADAGERVADAFTGDPEVKAGGTSVAAFQISEQSEDDTRRIELYAAPVLLLLLLAVFRSLVAAALPLLLSGISILITFAALNGIARVVDVDLFALQVVTGLGVGLAIDYSLFILARYRNELRAGGDYAAAQTRTMQTAGRTVAFSALTVAAALAALILFPNQFLRSTGIAGALVALLSGGAALVVLPALLALLGPRVDPGFASAPSTGPARDPLSDGSTFWRTAARRVLARPLPVATLALALLLAMGSPAADGAVTTPDARVLPEGETSKQVGDAASTGFPALSLTRLSVFIPAAAEPSAVRDAREALAAEPGVADVSSRQELGDGSGEVVVRAGLDPLSDPAQDLVETTRAQAWPAGTLVGGRAAELADQRASIESGAIPVVAVVVLTNLLLVLLTVRSLVLPLVAISLNALTVLASYGLMVALFENSTTAELLGTSAQDGIDISVPILAFAVVFGLSTDYGIFLFTRIAEARRNGMSDEDAIAEGISRTGQLITSAAVIFSVAVGAFAFSDLVIVKEFAVAVSIAVLLDATLVRGLLVPSLLGMLGARAWRWPGKPSPTRRDRDSARPATQ